MANILLSLSILLVVVPHQCYGVNFAQFGKLIKEEILKDSHSNALALPVFVAPQDHGLKDSDKIDRLPGQPYGIDFNQYSGYVTVDSKAGRAFFYYFVESSQDASSKPLLLWFSGGIGCSSFGIGALTEIGPFRVNKDSKTLYLNQYAWNRDANILFVESPVGVGFSYSNTSSDYEQYGDTSTAYDTYNFLVNWLERFPEYKSREIFLAGETYAGHYATQLAQLILRETENSNQTKINLKGIALGNAYIDYESSYYGSLDYSWTHSLISDEIYHGIKLSCNLSSEIISEKCIEYFNLSSNVTARINPYDIYAPLCNSTIGLQHYNYIGPCSTDYVLDYIGNPDVQIALHANVANASYPWKICNFTAGNYWTDHPHTVLPIITELVQGGIKVWIYSGDTDGLIPVTSAKYAINKLGLSVTTPWYPWYLQNEVAGYVVEYQNLIFVTVRGAGHFVPDSQPARALALFSSFINGKFASTT